MDLQTPPPLRASSTAPSGPAQRTIESRYVRLIASYEPYPARSSNSTLALYHLPLPSALPLNVAPFATLGIHDHSPVVRFCDSAKPHLTSALTEPLSRLASR